jgi:hypothetical protein
MIISQSEIQEYYHALKNVYGNDVIIDNFDLSSDFQEVVEKRRYLLNSTFQIGKNGLEIKKWEPGHILLLGTQYCTMKCQHCILFCSPETKLELPINVFDSIFSDAMINKIKGVSLSGGEIFLHKDIFHIVKSYPVKSIVTNGVWTTDTESLNCFLTKFKISLKENPFFKHGEFYFTISLDKNHLNNEGIALCNISYIITWIYDNLKDVKLCLERVQIENDESLNKLFDLLKSRGLIIQTSNYRKTVNINSYISSFSIKKQGHQERAIYVDNFPNIPLGRSLLYKAYSMNESKKEVDRCKISTLTLKSQYVDLDSNFQYVIGPDGNITIHNVYLIPPNPYIVGNFIHENWDTILNRVSRDPIAIMIRNEKVDKIINLIEDDYTDFYTNIASNSDSIQQLLYLLLLNPERRIYINLLALRYCIENDYLKTSSKSIKAVLKKDDKDLLQWSKALVGSIRRDAMN